MNENRPTPTRLALLLASIALPVALVLAALVAAGELSVHAALLGGAAIVLVLGLFGVKLLQDLWSIIAYAGTLSQLPPSAESPPPPSLRLAPEELRAVVRRLERGRAIARERLQAQAAAEQALLDELPDAILIVGGDRRLLRANRRARALFGNTIDGRDIAMAIRHPAILEAVDATAAGHKDSLSFELSLPGSVKREFMAYVRRLPDADAGGAAAVIALHDLTSVKRAEQMRADFVANVSHELRTPLSTIIGFVETLRGPARDDATARERFLSIMDEQSARMARLIEDLLSLSQIELVEHETPSTPVDICDTIRTVIKMLEVTAAEKAMPLETDFETGLPPVRGDNDQLVEVFQNLIENAIKYGEKETPVTITVRREGSRIAAAVTNRGEPIAREHLPRLTERFYRVDNARSRRLGGTGLGLAIVKHIVNRHRGSLAIDSGAEQGTVFTVYFPAR
ncbi:sensor histidine kinase [Oceanibacterium hippocampi]|uniref:histidine kinase n=1 Tax=Oceanibacterium hippocampi TaxID=745714 RepID=A0A1Y5SBJ7_9PROT|nr:ATP-binding protein [Oceanibacterium hippocampi]SLN36875.1 Alkaline phosphatase synthesis sensor protein PhoR [Oceanibacterium hippocampi]